MEVSDGTQKRKIAELAEEIARLDENWPQTTAKSEPLVTPSSSANVKVEPSSSSGTNVPARAAVNTADPNQPNQNISIYHLLLDAQLDLKR